MRLRRAALAGRRRSERAGADPGRRRARRLPALPYLNVDDSLHFVTSTKIVTFIFHVPVFIWKLVLTLIKVGTGGKEKTYKIDSLRPEQRR